jgi:hypothetical protein
MTSVDEFAPAGVLIVFAFLGAIGLAAVALGSGQTKEVDAAQIERLSAMAFVPRVLKEFILCRIALFSPRRIMLDNLGVAVLIAFLLAVISFDYNRVQETYNEGAILLVVGSAVVSLCPLGIRIMLAKVSISDLLFARFAPSILMGVAFGTYTIFGSIRLGRVL